MKEYLWSFWLFSFLGYLLEKGYARATASPRQNRKCFILLPLCPVYGVAVTAVLWMEPALRGHPLAFSAACALLPCAVEYALHWYYERCFHVRFWDYRTQPMQLHGRICLRFALVWTVLMPPAVRLIAPWMLPRLAALPPWVGFAVWMVFAADGMLSRLWLWRCRDTERLTLRALRAR